MPLQSLAFVRLWLLAVAHQRGRRLPLCESARTLRPSWLHCCDVPCVYRDVASWQRQSISRSMDGPSAVCRCVRSSAMPAVTLRASHSRPPEDDCTAGGTPRWSGSSRRSNTTAGSSFEGSVSTEAAQDFYLQTTVRKLLSNFTPGARLPTHLRGSRTWHGVRRRSFPILAATHIK